MNYHGFYINLDRRPDRRTEIEGELAQHNAAGRYQRFAAAEGNSLGLANPHLANGEMGCFTSHYLLLKQNLDSDKTIHIIEDDVLFAPNTVPLLDALVGQDLLAGCDIVYTDVFMPIQTTLYKAYKSAYDKAVTLDADGHVNVHEFNVTDIKTTPFGSTSSYLVAKNSIQKLYDLYHHEITNAPLESNDLFIRRLAQQGKIKVGCVFPFITSVNLDHIIETDINRGYHQASALAAHMGRYSFFIGADMKKARLYMDKFLSLPATQTDHDHILNQLLAFSITEKYEHF